jgi:hypothetical protein
MFGSDFDATRWKQHVAYSQVYLQFLILFTTHYVSSVGQIRIMVKYQTQITKDQDLCPLTSSTLSFWFPR